jgi:hypothetical protein
VRSAQDVLTALELPVLGVLLKPGSSKTSGDGNGSLMQQRLLAPIHPSGKAA